jgi:hypothetical protein
VHPQQVKAQAKKAVLADLVVTKHP